MPGYRYEFVDTVPRRHFCGLCRLPAKEAVQITGCGHRFCDSCLEEYLSEGVFKCPEDAHPLDYAKIYADPAAQMELEASLIRCVHHKAGCRWVDKLQGLQGHLATCRYDSVPCPKDCGARLSRMCLQDHLQYTCASRRVVCTSCNKEFSGEAMEAHQGNCPFEVTWCENKCGARLQLRYLNNHMKNECHKRTMPCPYCNKQFVYETLQNHYYQCPRYPVSCPNRCDPAKIPREDVEHHVHDNCPSVAVPCSFERFGCKHVCPRYNLEQHLADATKQHLNLMCDLSLTQERRIHDLTHQLHVLSLVTDGTFIWRVPKFKEQLAEAKAKPGLELLSDPFYTGRYGYKLGASAFLNGNGSGEDTHLSLYIRVLQGDYDNLLEWPFRLPITFRIMDQCSDPEKREHIVESFVPNPAWKHFQRPTKNVETLGFGYPKFISQDTLKNGTYIKDDTLFIKIEVDNTRFISP